MLYCGKTKIGATERSIIQSFTQAVNEAADNIPPQTIPVRKRFTISNTFIHLRKTINYKIKLVLLLNQYFTSLVEQFVHSEINSLSIISIYMYGRFSQWFCTSYTRLLYLSTVLYLWTSQHQHDGMLVIFTFCYTLRFLHTHFH